MPSAPLTVDEYLKEVPPDRFAALQELRRMCRTHLRGYEEIMLYGGSGIRCHRD